MNDDLQNNNDQANNNPEPNENNEKPKSNSINLNLSAGGGFGTNQSTLSLTNGSIYSSPNGFIEDFSASPKDLISNKNSLGVGQFNVRAGYNWLPGEYIANTGINFNVSLSNVNPMLIGAFVEVGKNNRIELAIEGGAAFTPYEFVEKEYTSPSGNVIEMGDSQQAMRGAYIAGSIKVNPIKQLPLGLYLDTKTAMLRPSDNEYKFHISEKGNFTQISSGLEYSFDWGDGGHINLKAGYIKESTKISLSRPPIGTDALTADRAEATFVHDDFSGSLGEIRDAATGFQIMLEFEGGRTNTYSDPVQHSQEKGTTLLDR